MPHVVIEEAIDLAVACPSVQLTAVRTGASATGSTVGALRSPPTGR
jgi:hypothetical protein